MKFNIKLLSNKNNNINDSLVIEAFNSSSTRLYRCRIYQKCIEKIKEWKNTFHLLMNSFNYIRLYIRQVLLKKCCDISIISIILSFISNQLFMKEII